MGRKDLFRRHHKVSPASGCGLSAVTRHVSLRRGLKNAVRWMLCIAAMFPLPSHAQWRFEMQVQVSGNCGGWGSLAQKNAQAALDHYWNSLPGMIPTKVACENARAVINGYTTKMDGCTARIICTPCIGRDIGNSLGAAAGDLSYLNNYQLGGPDKGMASFSSNPNDEIKQWQDEVERKMENFAYFNGASSGLGYVETRDSDFDEMYADNLKDKDGILYVKRGVAPKGRGVYIGEGKFQGIPDSENSYVDEKKVDEMLKKSESSMDSFLEREWHFPEDMEAYVQTLFERFSGYDIRTLLEAMRTRVPTREELIILLEYDAYKGKFYAAVDKKYAEKIDKINMAENHHVALAGAAYSEINNPVDNVWRLTLNPNDGHWPESLNKEQIRAIQDVMKGIQTLNRQGKDTGFSMHLYYDGNLKELTFACRGSDTGEHNSFTKDIIQDWLKTNLVQASGGLSEQHGSAISLANKIKELNALLSKTGSDIKINFVGHSLGGGLASMLGLATGLPTYTYNAAGVHDNTLKKFGLFAKKESASQNITAYYSQNDVLSNFQDKSPAERLVFIAKSSKGSDTFSKYASFGDAIITLITHPDDVKEASAYIYNKILVNDPLSLQGIKETMKDGVEIGSVLIKAFNEAPAALGKRVNIGDAGKHELSAMKDNFAGFGRTYRSEEWKKLTATRSLLSEAKEIDNAYKTILIQ